MTDQLSDARVLVENLEATVQESDVRRHFLRFVPHSNPNVHKLASNHVGHKYTTVIFSHPRGARGRKEAYHELQSNYLTDDTGRKSKIILDDTYYGLHTVSESSSDPSFDVCFVHGLNGHAYRTWESPSKTIRGARLWFRDFLPEYLERSGVFGRYLTFGYDASPYRGRFTPDKIRETAVQLLMDLKSYRFQNYDRPLFFVGHSLGGLVICQAILLLSQVSGTNEVPEDLRAAFHSSGKIVVKGATFFGTPFKGSMYADFVLPIFPLLRFNKSFVSDLRRENKKITKMLQDFDSSRYASDPIIPLLVYFEKFALKNLSIPKIVSRVSAKGIFKDSVDRIPVEKDHVQMCRFENSQDQFFVRRVCDQFLLTIRSALIQNPVFLLHDHHDVGPIRNRGNIHTVPGFVNIVGSRVIETADVDDMRSRLGLINLPSSQSVSHPLAGTCNWIKENTMYKEWNSADRDAMLFIRGQPGVGKSVLARFIAEDISSHATTSQPLVVHISCKEIGSREDPKTFILRHILFRLCEVAPNAIMRYETQRRVLQGERRTFDFYWQMYRNVRLMSAFDLVCIIDGLDECIKTIIAESGHDIDRGLVSFLEVLCQEMTGPCNRTNGQTKLLLTTRPVREVEKVLAKFPNIVYDIATADVLPGVSAVIEANMLRLALYKGISENIRLEMTQELKQMAGPMHQWVTSVMIALWDCDVVSESQQYYLDVLRKHKPNDINSPYEEALRTIEDSATLKPEDKNLIALLLELIVFSETPLTLRDAQCALAYRHIESAEVRKHVLTPATALESIIRSYCSSLLNLEGEAKFVVLAHSSVKTYLLDLRVRELSKYSCINIDRAHWRILGYCLICLSSWWTSYNAYRKDDESVGNLDEKSAEPFVAYACIYWDDHLRKITNFGSLTILLSILFDTDVPMYDCMHLVRQKYTDDGKKLFTPPPISLFLAENNLLNLVRYCSIGGHRAKPSLRRFLPKWFQRSTNKPHIHIHETDSQGNTMLHLAASSGSIDLVNYLLDKGAKGSRRNQHGKTPLWSALSSNCENIALLLFKRGHAELETPSRQHPTSLQFAAYYGMEEIARRLLARGVETDDPNVLGGYSALYISCRYGNDGVARLLLDNGASPAAEDKNKLRPLHAATVGGHLNIAELLFQHYPQLDPSPFDVDGDTPLHLAASKGHADLFKFLLGKQSQVLPNKDGILPVHAAVLGGSRTVLELVLPSEYDIPDKHGRTSLVHAILENSEDMVTYLLKHGVDVNSKSTPMTYPKSQYASKCSLMTPVVYACQLGNPKIVELLVDAGAKLDWKDDKNRNLFWYIDFKSPAITRMLLSSGVSTTHICNDGSTPLHNAAMEAANFDFLLADAVSQGNFDANCRDEFGATPLYYAASAGNEVNVRSLLHNGADPKSCSDSGATLIGAAARCPSAQLIRLFIEHGVDPKESDKRGVSPLYIAAHRNDIDSCQILLPYYHDALPLTLLQESPIQAACIAGNPKLLGAYPWTSHLTEMDATGKTPLDLITPRNPASTILENEIKFYQRAEEEARVAHIRRSIPHILHHELLSFSPGTTFFPLETWLAAAPFLSLRSEDQTTRILLESALTRMNQNRCKAVNECAKCGKTTCQIPLHRCRACDDLYLCAPCFQSFEEGNTPEFCVPEHEYFTFADQEWWDRDDDVVDDQRQSFPQFIQQLKARWKPDE